MTPSVHLPDDLRVTGQLDFSGCNLFTLPAWMFPQSELPRGLYDASDHDDFPDNEIE